MAWVKELDDVSSATLCMDTLAMDHIDMRPEAFRITEAHMVLTGAQSKVGSKADSGVGKKALQDKFDVYEIVDPILGAQESDSSEAEETRYDDNKNLMTDLGTHTYGTLSNPSAFQEVFPEGAYELDKEMNIDMVENDLDEETGCGDEGLMTDLDTPETIGTLQDMNLDETRYDLDAENGFDDEALDSGAGKLLEEALEDVHELNETKDSHVDVAENGLSSLDEGEEYLDSQKFVASFPITRVKRIIKLDKDVRLVSSDAIALVAQATALFVQSLSSASFAAMLQFKRKTIRGRDVVLAAQITRQFRECLGNDLATFLEESNEGTAIGDDGLVGKEHGTGREPFRKKPQLTPASRLITKFFNVQFEV